MRTRTRWRAWRWSAAVLVVTACGSRVPVAKPPTTPAVTAATSTAATTAPTVPSVTSAPPASTTTPTTSPSTSAAFDEAAAQAQIIANWEKFFTPGTSVDERVALLQDGSALRAAIEQSASNPLQQQARAKVTQVRFTSPTEATVTYDVYLNGTVALPNSQGMAVLEGGTWKVAQQSFCSLISLGVSGPIPGCS